MNNFRRKIINSLSKAQLENVDARGEAVIQVEVEKLQSLFEEQFLELIGEDEQAQEPIVDNTKMGEYELNNLWFNYGKQKEKFKDRNQLRAELKQKIKERSRGYSL